MAEPASESRTESEVPPEGVQEPSDLEREQSEVPAESGEAPLSRMETNEELAALAEEEKVEEVAPDITTDSAALMQPEQPSEPPAEGTEAPTEEPSSTEEGKVEGEPTEETAAPDTEVPASEEPSSTTEGEAPKPEGEGEGETAAEPAAPAEEAAAEAPAAEATADEAVEKPVEPESAPEAAEQSISEVEDAAAHSKVERKVSRARFEPLRSAIEEEETDGDNTDRDHKHKGGFEPMGTGRQSNLSGEFAAGSDEEIEEEALPKFSRQQMIESIQQQLAERDALKLKNQNIQHKLALYFQNKRAEDRSGTSETVGEGEQKYASLLSKYTDLVREKRILDERSREQLDGLRERREQLRNDGESLLTQLRELKKATVLASISVKTGKAPQWEDVETEFTLEAKKDTDIHKLLIENIILRNRIHKIEDTMKAKDKLGEGLHMIDFEQLKIENQTYNEKIEERNEDISKLRKKITTSVEVLTHVKEKLEYLKHENEAQKIRLEDVDKTLAVKRAKVSRLKQSRDSLRNDNEKLRQSAGLLGKNDLLRDFENKVDEAELLRRRLADLQVTHAEVNMSNAALMKKINGLKASNPNLQATIGSESAKPFHSK